MNPNVIQPLGADRLKKESDIHKSLVHHIVDLIGSPGVYCDLHARILLLVNSAYLRHNLHRIKLSAADCDLAL